MVNSITSSLHSEPQERTTELFLTYPGTYKQQIKNCVNSLDSSLLILLTVSNMYEALKRH